MYIRQMFFLFLGSYTRQLHLIFKFCTAVNSFSSVFIIRQNWLESNFSYVLKLLVINFDSHCDSFAKSMFLTDNQRDKLFSFNVVYNLYM